MGEGSGGGGGTLTPPTTHPPPNSPSPLPEAPRKQEEDKGSRKRVGRAGEECWGVRRLRGGGEWWEDGKGGEEKSAGGEKGLGEGRFRGR